MVNNAYDRALADAALANGADIVAFGRPFIANPDLVERLKQNAPLNELNRDTLYGGGAKGYTDYPPASQVAAVAEREMALPYDVVARVASTPLTHDGEHCSFDAFVRHYRLNGDKALVHLARVVRGADTHRPDLSPSCEGLLAVSLGMARIHTNDHAMLNAMLPVYDALYAWCRDAVAAQDEQHNWNTA
jgi:hypothetical protein